MKSERIKAPSRGP